jgi:hypothetical protein
MIKACRDITISFLSTVMILLSLFPFHGQAQTVHFNMDVQPELGVEVLQDLNFGTVVTNSGTHQIGLGNPQMGIFKIRALAAQSAILTLQKPDRLTPSANQDTTNSIPLNLDAAYSPEATNYQDYLPFANNELQIILSGENDEQVWDTGYVYIFGNIDVGDIAPGSYSGTLVLNVVYQ